MRRWMTLLLLVTVLALSGWRLDAWVPRHWHPGQPLQVDDPLTPVTRWKLHRLADHPEGCLAMLQALPSEMLRATPLDDHEPVPGCPLQDVVRVQASGVEFDTGFIASCPLALAWVIFERQRLQPAAEARLGSRVTAVEHYGSFACRNVYGREDDRTSAHATASALDVAAFRLADGREARLSEHWGDTGERGTFLREVHDGACDVFGTVLGPDYNAAHADHFHLAMRGFRLCR